MNKFNPVANAEVCISVEGQKLYGILEVPQPGRSIIIFANASGSSRYNPRNRYIAEILRSYGCSTMLLDLLTSQEEADPQLAVDTRYDIFLLTKRLIAATMALGTDLGLGGVKLGYFASDTAAAAALCSAAELDGQINAIVSRGGRPDFAGASMLRVQAPMLFVTGENDEEVLRRNRMVFEHFPGVKDFQVIPGAGRHFEEPGALESMAKLTGQWFRKHLVGGNGLFAPHGA